MDGEVQGQGGQQEVVGNESTEEGRALADETSENIDAEQTPAGKRGRGRPKKATSAARPGTKRPAQDGDEDLPPAKRGRGRSKKVESTASTVAPGKASQDGKKDSPTKGGPKTPAGGGGADAGQSSTASAAKTKGKGKDKKGRDSVDGGLISKMLSTKSAAGNQTDWDKVDVADWNNFDTTKDGRKWSMKFSSWNVNGIRAWLKSGGLTYIEHEDPDIFCLQETKCSEADLPMDKLKVPGYHTYWYSAEKKGYSGTGLYTKTKPLNVTRGMSIDEHDNEGRLITMEFDKFYFLTTYVPNAGDGLKRLSYRQEWDVDFRDYLKKLDALKPVILCGDLNVAHEEIDLANPKSNQKTAGFTKEEREGFTQLLNEGFTDSFRHLYPDRLHAYTYWSYRMNARARNTGWRLDYFVVSERLAADLCDCVIRNEVYGSDHCPIVLALATE